VVANEAGDRDQPAPAPTCGRLSDEVHGPIGVISWTGARNFPDLSGSLNSAD
jgi:hypothetical protein